jgi:hypothetical protein
MLKRQAVTIATLAAIFAGSASGTIDAQQNKNETVTKASAARGPLSADANIKSASSDNRRDVANKIPIPPDKGGPLTRGGGELCSMRVSNSSPLHASVYIDGEYWGTTPAYGDLAGWMRCKAVHLYARANFDDGSYYYWGPASVSVKGNYTWRISR